MDWVSILAVVGTVCSIVFGYLAFTRNKTHDERGEGQQTGTILTTGSTSRLFSIAR